MKKRIISGLCATAMVISAAVVPVNESGVWLLRPMSVFAATGTYTTDDGFEFTVLDSTAGTAKITGYKGTKTDLVFPETVDGYTVTEIGYSAFCNKTTIKSVVIPDTVTRIGDYVFQGCTSLEKVTLPDGLTIISNNAFEGCTKLSEINMPSSLTYVYSCAFGYCNSLTRIDLPVGLKSLGSHCFANCYNLAEVSLPYTFKNWDAVPFANSPVLLYINPNTWCETFAKSQGLPYELVPLPLEECTVTGAPSIATYTGYPIKYSNYKATIMMPSSTQTDSLWTLEENVDFTLTYKDNTNAGTATAVFTGIGDYCGTVEKTFTIKPASLNSASVTPEISSFVYNGNERTPDVTVVWNRKTLARDTDYTVSYFNNIQVGNATVTVTGTGNFTGTASSTFQITDPALHTHHGVKQKTVPPTCEEQGYDVYYCAECGQIYKINYTNAKGHIWDTGRITASATCKNEGTREYTCYVCGGKKTESIPKTSHTYERYTVSEATCTSPGQVLCVCSGCNAYYYETTPVKEHDWNGGVISTSADCHHSGVRIFTCNSCGRTKTETIPQTQHNWEVVCVLEEPSCTDEGIVEYHCNLCGDGYTDYIPAKGHRFVDKVVPPTYYSEGYTEHTCSVCGYSYLDNFTPMKEHGDLFNATVTVSSCVYTGKALKPAVTVKLDGKTLKNGTDYTLSFKNNTKCGRATVTATGKGGYTNYKSAKFVIKPKKVTISGIKSPNTKQLRVTWKKSPGGVSGYEVLVATNKSFSKNKATAVASGGNSTAKTVGGLKKGKKYYAKVRAYKTLNGKKYYGAWSAVKSVKCK